VSNYSVLEERPFPDVLASHSLHISYILKYYRHSQVHDVPCSDFELLIQHIESLVESGSTCWISVYHHQNRLGYGHYTRAPHDDKRLLLLSCAADEQGVARGLCEAINTRYSEMEA
jgi:hypothetical protein